MAKKKATKAVTKKRPAKKAGPVPQVKAEPAGRVVVFFELANVGALRYHSDYDNMDRARTIARVLLNSPDVSQAYIIRDVELVSRPSG